MRTTRKELDGLVRDFAESMGYRPWTTPDDVGRDDVARGAMFRPMADTDPRWATSDPNGYGWVLTMDVWTPGDRNGTRYRLVETYVYRTRDEVTGEDVAMRYGHGSDRYPWGESYSCGAGAMADRVRYALYTVGHLRQTGKLEDI